MKALGLNRTCHSKRVRNKIPVKKERRLGDVLNRDLTAATLSHTQVMDFTCLCAWSG